MIHSSHEVAERACKLGFCAPSTGQIQGIPYRLDGFIPEGSVIYASIVTPNECYWAIHKFIFERKQLQHLSRKTGTYVHQHWTCTIHYNTVVNTLATRRIADFKLLSARHVKKWYLGYCCWWCKYMFPCIYIYISYTYIYNIHAVCIEPQAMAWETLQERQRLHREKPTALRLCLLYCYKHGVSVSQVLKARLTPTLVVMVL